MKNTEVLIHAAGRSERWQADYPKHLAMVAGETILGRVIRRCREQGLEPLLVTNDARLEPYAERVLHPERCHHHVETLLCSRDYWKRRTIVLFGDVLYTGSFLSSLFSEYPAHSFYGDASQLFAVSFCRRREVRCAIGGLLQDVDQHQHGRLLDLCRYLDGLDIGQDDYGVSHKIVEDPWVCDVDSVMEWKDLIAKTGGRDMWG